MILIWLIGLGQFLAWILWKILRILSRLPMLCSLIENWGSLVLWYQKIIRGLVQKVFGVHSLVKLSPFMGVEGSNTWNQGYHANFSKYWLIAMAPSTIGTLLFIFIWNQYQLVATSPLLIQILMYGGLVLLVSVNLPNYQDWCLITHSIKDRPFLFLRQLLFLLITDMICYYYQDWFASWNYFNELLQELGSWLLIYGILEGSWAFIVWGLRILDPQARKIAPVPLTVHKYDPIRTYHIKTDPEMTAHKNPKEKSFTQIYQEQMENQYVINISSIRKLKEK